MSLSLRRYQQPSPHVPRGAKLRPVRRRLYLRRRGSSAEEASSSTSSSSPSFENVELPGWERQLNEKLLARVWGRRRAGARAAGAVPTAAAVTSGKGMRIEKEQNYDDDDDDDNEDDDASFVQLGKYKGPPKQVVLCGRGQHASHALARNLWPAGVHFIEVELVLGMQRGDELRRQAREHIMLGTKPDNAGNSVSSFSSSRGAASAEEVRCPPGCHLKRVHHIIQEEEDVVQDDGRVGVEGGGIGAAIEAWSDFDLKKQHLQQQHVRCCSLGGLMSSCGYDAHSPSLWCINAISTDLMPGDADAHDGDARSMRVEDIVKLLQDALECMPTGAQMVGLLPKAGVATRGGGGGGENSDLGGVRSGETATSTDGGDARAMSTTPIDAQFWRDTLAEHGMIVIGIEEEGGEEGGDTDANTSSVLSPGKCYVVTGEKVWPSLAQEERYRLHVEHLEADADEDYYDNIV